MGPARSLVFSMGSGSRRVLYGGVAGATYHSQCNGSEYARDYKLSILEVLNRPNTTGFFFEGGLLAHLALHYGSPELLTHALEGPSAAITLHGAGHNDYSCSTCRESVSEPEKNVLLGQSKPGGAKSKTHYIWLPVVIFQARFLKYEGRWTDDCEKWFQERAAHIKGGFVDAKMEGGWWQHLQHSSRHTRITDDQWSAIEGEILTTQGASWEGVPLHTIFNTDNPANDYMDL